METPARSPGIRAAWLTVARQAWRLAALHAQVHDWSFGHFPDREHGEWFGWLHRDGSVSQRAKGNMFKGPFHLPRMLWFCAKKIEG